MDNFKVTLNKENTDTNEFFKCKENLECLFLSIAVTIRADMLKYIEDKSLQGCCVEASEEIQKTLEMLGFKPKLIEGWCKYEDASSCTDRDYDMHSWIECNGYYIDITASQFNYFMNNKLSDIIVSKEKPACMHYREPR